MWLTYLNNPFTIIITYILYLWLNNPLNIISMESPISITIPCVQVASHPPWRRPSGGPPRSPGPRCSGVRWACGGNSRRNNRDFEIVGFLYTICIYIYYINIYCIIYEYIYIVILYYNIHNVYIYIYIYCSLILDHFRSKLGDRVRFNVGFDIGFHLTWDHHKYITNTFFFV